MKNNLEENCEEKSSENVCQEKDKNYSINSKEKREDDKIKEPGLLYHILDYCTRLF